MVTIFKNIRETKEPHYITAEQALERIAHGKSKDLVCRIRMIEDKEERNALKGDLPSICFSGEFETRSKDGFKKHSGLICLDFDDVDPALLKARLKLDSYIMAAFVSPSATGVKALVKIPVDDHEASFKSLHRRWPGIDPSGKDVSRVCFESFDPELYYNPDSLIFKDYEPVFTATSGTVKETDTIVIFNNLIKWLESKDQYFTKGNRNVFCLQLFGALNRFGVSEADARDLVLNNYVRDEQTFTIKEMDRVLQSVYENYSHQHGTSHFERTGKDIVDKSTGEIVSEQVINVEDEKKDLYILDDLYQDILRTYNDGLQMGESTGIPGLDTHYRLMRKEITCLHGFGNHGKSHFLQHICMNRAKEHGEKFVFFNPENFPPDHFYMDLIEIFTHKSFKKNVATRMTRDELIPAAQFVNDHFFYIYPEEDDPTPDYILKRFEKLIAKKGIDGVIIDPFNQMNHKVGEREDQYLSALFTKFKRWAVAQDVYFWIVAHPANRVDMNGKNYAAPYYTHLSGGMMWANKMDNILVYHRPNFRTDPDDRTCLVASQKIKKQKINGIPGKVELIYKRAICKYELTADVLKGDKPTQKDEEDLPF